MSGINEDIRAQAVVEGRSATRKAIRSLLCRHGSAVALRDEIERRVTYAKV